MSEKVSRKIQFNKLQDQHKWIRSNITVEAINIYFVLRFMYILNP